ncbi:UNVERIFIED_CONTAM: Heterogeneous nuclear ribonucleoprotein 1 [Sesamum radiatum]|uniref:Heterogeneous nuclear ribonucleoprotein 1 n=1 Tax=Sesamum radiatum TaxID=300843 RepID=A0AAW2PHN4_SESRA
MLDKISGRPRGFGFVTFADPEVADKVLQEDHVIDGRAVEVKRTVPREDMQGRGVSRTKKIFVGGLPLSLNEGEIEIKRAEPKRSGFDHSSESRLRRCRRWHSSKASGSFAGGSEGFGGVMVVKWEEAMVVMVAMEGYGGYGYGYGFGGPMYSGGAYGGCGFGAPVGYGGAAGYGVGKGYTGAGGGYDGGKGFGGGGNGGGGYGPAKGYGGGGVGGGGGGGGYGSGKGYGTVMPLVEGSIPTESDEFC